MGQYLSQPSTEKESDEGHGDTLGFGLAAMQGWRVSMEDAHIAELNLDPVTHTSLFSVFDGHGGGAVSQYCAAHLAEELLASEAYRRGDLATAITEAYYHLDQRLDSEEGKAELRRLVQASKPKQQASLFTDVESKLSGPAEAHEERVRASKATETEGQGEGEPDMLVPLVQAAGGGGSSTGGGGGSSTGGGGGGGAEPSSAGATGASSAHSSSSAGAGSGGGSGSEQLEAEAQHAMKKLGSSKDFLESHLQRVSVLGPREAAAADQKQGGGSGGGGAAPLQSIESGAVLPAAGAPAVESPALPNGGGSTASDEEEEEEHHAAGQGATAVSVIVRGNKVVVANTGDSRCVLSKKGQARALTLDHKPILFEEAKRIIKAGGFVRDNRINGALNVSRTIGDLDFKRNAELPHTEQMVVATPDIETFTLEDGDEFLILACDGIWDVLTNQEAVDFVRKRLKAGDSLKHICEQMCDSCLAPDLKGLCRGADNMSVVLVLFKRHAKLGGFWSSLLSSCKRTPAYKKGADGETTARRRWG